MNSNNKNLDPSLGVRDVRNEFDSTPSPQGVAGFCGSCSCSAFQQVMNPFRSRSTSRLSALPDVTNMKIQGYHAAGCGGRF